MKLVFLLVFLNIFNTAVPLSAEPARLIDPGSRYQLGENIGIYVDPRGMLTPEEIYKRKEVFDTISKESVQIPRNGIMWILLTIENRSEAESWILENSMTLEQMDLFEKVDGSLQLTQTTGDMVPFSKRSLDIRKPSFELRIPAGEKKEYLIRLFDYQSSSLVLTMEEIGRYSRRYSRETFILGLIFGFFLLLIIYNLFVFIFNREKTYLYYALYMAAFFLNQFSQERLLLQFILPDQSFGYFWFVLFGGSTLFFGIQFFRHFIETKKKMPKLDKVMTGGVILSGILVGSSLFFHGPFSADILNILSLGSMGLIFAALIMRIIRKDILALVCFIGSLLYLIGTSVEILMTFLPLQITSFVLNAQLYGAAAQVVFIAFAVGAKSFKLRKRYNEMQKHFRKDLETRVGERTRELEEANKKLALYAITDSLTGLYNRSELNSRIVELDNLIARRSGTEKPYEIAAAYMDLDNFKRCNDTLGHRSGDRLLIMVAEILKQNTRGYDMIFRIGGDEFLIIMPETGLKESYRIVERIRSKIEEDFRKDTEVPISVSIGLAATQQLTDPDMESLIHQADIALLRSKDQGKNTVFFAS